MQRLFYALCALSLATVTGPAYSQPSHAVEVPAPPGVPTAEQRARAAAAQITKDDKAQVQNTANVSQTTDKTGLITEYKRDGDTYLIEARPEQGATMYLEDNDGDGTIDTKDSDLGADTSLPKWKIGRW